MKTYKVEKVRRMNFSYYQVFFEGEWCDMVACVNCKTVGFLPEKYYLKEYDRLRVCGCENPNWYRSLFGTFESVSEFVKKYYGDVE